MRSVVLLYVRVLRELGPERRLAWSLFAANLVLVVAQFAEPWLFGRIVDALVQTRPTHAPLTFLGLMPLVIAWLAVGFFNIAAGVLVSLHADRLAHRRRLSVLSRYFGHVLSLPLGFHGETHSGRLLKVMLGGSEAMWNVWLNLLREHVVSLLSLLFLLPASLLFEPRLGLLLSLFVLGFSFGMYRLMRGTYSRQDEVNELSSVLSEHAADSLGNLPLVQSFTRVNAEIVRLDDIGRRFLAAQLPVLNWWAVASVSTRAASTITVTGVLLLGTWLHVNGQASVGQVVSSMSLAHALIGRLESTLNFLNALFRDAPRIQQFFAMMDQRSGVGDAPDAIEATGLRGQVAFEQVSFSYQPPRQALRDVSFVAAPGEQVALVGATGSGKTTTLGLLYRAYDPAAGRILVDGMDLRSYSLDSLRRNIAVVFQEPLLFARSIRENLLVGKPDAAEAELWEALARAQAAELVEKLPEGLDTVLSERGRSLSGGERQRLSIARALLKAPPILILDEATAPLDALTEAKLSLALEEVMRDRTTLIIAHRLATVRHATRILVLDHGRVVESGSFDELVARKGRFAMLARAQLLT